MPKPSTLPRWAETAGGTPAANIVAPNSGKQDTGYATGGDVPTSGGLNWLFNTILAWLKYINSLFETANAALEVTGQAGKSGVVGTGGAGGNGVVGAGTGSGMGIVGTSGTNFGVYGTGGTNQPGVKGQGNGTGAGVYGVGDSSPGVKAETGGGGTRGALNIVPQAAPSTPADGDVWIDSGTNTIKVRINGVTKTFTIT